MCSGSWIQICKLFVVQQQLNNFAWLRDVGEILVTDNNVLYLHRVLREAEK